MLRTAVAFFIAAVSVTAQSEVPVPKYEDSPALKATDILKPEYVSGPNHKVLDQVTTFYGRNSYTIETKWGYFIAEGDAMLLLRVAEANAIAELQRLALTDEYKDALKLASDTPGYAERLRDIEASNWKEKREGALRFIAQDGDATKAPANYKPSADSLTSSEQNSPLARMMRGFAIQLGTEPYSRNEVYEQLLTRFAWTAVCSKKAFILSPGPVGNQTGLALKAKDLTRNFQEALRDASPKELLAANRRAVVRMKAAAKDVDAFLSNAAFSPTMQTAVVRALDSLTDVENRASFVRMAARNAVSEADSVFFAGTAQLLATLHSAQDKLAKLSALGELPVAIAADGRLVIALRWDTAFWHQLVERFIERAAAANLGQTGPIAVIITGNATPRFKSELEKRKITLVTNVFGGPQK